MFIVNYLISIVFFHLAQFLKNLTNLDLTLTGTSCFNIFKGGFTRNWGTNPGLEILPFGHTQNEIPTYLAERGSGITS